MVASREDAAMSQPYVRILGFESALRVVIEVPEQLDSLNVEGVSRTDPSSSSYWVVLWECACCGSGITYIAIADMKV